MPARCQSVLKPWTERLVGQIHTQLINIKYFTGRSSLHQTMKQLVCLKNPSVPSIFCQSGKTSFFSALFSSPTQLLGHLPVSSLSQCNDLRSTHPEEGRALQHCLSSFTCGFFYWQHLPLKSLPAYLKISTVLPLPSVMGPDLGTPMAFLPGDPKLRRSHCISS